MKKRRWKKCMSLRSEFWPSAPAPQANTEQRTREQWPSQTRCAGFRRTTCARRRPAGKTIRTACTTCAAARTCSLRSSMCAAARRGATLAGVRLRRAIWRTGPTTGARSGVWPEPRVPLTTGRARRQRGAAAQQQCVQRRRLLERQCAAACGGGRPRAPAAALLVRRRAAAGVSARAAAAGALRRAL